MKHPKIEYQRFADIKRLKFIENILSVSINHGSKILDVGCGNGIISRYLGSLGYEVLGIEIDQKAIQKANELNNLSNVKFSLKNVEELKSEGILYDAIICSEVLEHLSNPARLLNILHQSLQANGLIIVTVPNGFGPRELIITKPCIYLRKNNVTIWKSLTQFKKLLGFSGTTPQSDSDNLEHIQFFSKRTLEKLAHNNNFKIKLFQQTNFLDDVFPFSIIAKHSFFLQKIDAKIADLLPTVFSGGFMTIWEKK